MTIVWWMRGIGGSFSDTKLSENDVEHLFHANHARYATDFVGSIAQLLGSENDVFRR